MWELFGGEKGEKKVEYIELIYDLIFVYLIGRSNEILFHMQGGFFTFQTYLTFLYSTLVILQIWYFSSLYINRYGSNSAVDYIGLFINMYLLYFLAEGIRVEDMSMYPQYNVAWALILLNIAAQYYRQLKFVGAATPWASRHLKYRGNLLLIQAGIILVSIPVYYLTGMAFSWVSMVFGFVAAVFASRVDSLMPVNSEHLTERVMLFVVFTFGETIVSIGAYFAGDVNLSTIYFSLMAFLIVAGMFLTYGLLYDKVIDRERVVYHDPHRAHHRPHQHHPGPGIHAGAGSERGGEERLHHRILPAVLSVHVPAGLLCQVRVSGGAEVLPHPVPHGPRLCRSHGGHL